MILCTIVGLQSVAAVDNGKLVASGVNYQHYDGYVGDIQTSWEVYSYQNSSEKVSITLFGLRNEKWKFLGKASEWIDFGNNSVMEIIDRLESQILLDSIENGVELWI